MPRLRKCVLLSVALSPSTAAGALAIPWRMDRGALHNDDAFGFDAGSERVLCLVAGLRSTFGAGKF